MGEMGLIEGTEMPASVSTLTVDLRALGVRPGDVLIVHTSMRSIGWVAGGAAAVVDALAAAVGPDGTVTMPAHSGDWSDPAGWENPAVPSAWWETIVQQRPAFDPYATPLREMGAVADNLLMRRATLRSAHPLHSHMAFGARAAEIVADHPLEDSFGDRSPLGRLYDLDAVVVLLGVGHENNTSLHLAESRATWPGKTPVEYRSTILVDDRPQVVNWSGDDVDADDFAQVGAVLDEAGITTTGHVGLAVCRIGRMRAIVDAAVSWLETNRGASA